MLEVFAILVLAAAEEVHPFPREAETVTALELWNPFTWWLPFGIAQAESWSNYLKQTQRASNRLYRLIRRYIQSGLFNRLSPNGNRVKDQGVQKPNRTASAARAAEDAAPAPADGAGGEHGGQEEEGRPTTGEISGAGRWK